MAGPHIAVTIDAPARRSARPAPEGGPGAAVSRRPTKAAKLVFVVTEDWFFASHFLPMARAAVRLGLDVAVVTRRGTAYPRIEATGARVIGLDIERRAIGPASLIDAVRRTGAVLEAEKPDIVHCVSLRSILVGGLAARLSGVERRIFALTGLGFLGAADDARRRAARRLVRAVIRGPLESASTRYLVANWDDAAFLGLSPGDERARIVGGAGIDPAAFDPAAKPAASPLKVAIVSRMLWTKGIDVAVQAVARARADGVDVMLSLFGDVDPANPKSLRRETLEAWGRLDGIAWHGHRTDIPALWRKHHVCCLPSRGGEGLPRSLLEGAAAGRALLTTDTPGCRSFVRDGQDGLVVPPNDSGALARAFAELARDPERREAMGASARARVLSGYTQAEVEDTYRTLLIELLETGRPTQVVPA